MADLDPRAAFVAGLREIADLYEAIPELQLPYQPDLSVIAIDPDGFATQSRVLGGQRTKTATDQIMRVGRTFGPIVLEVVACRDVVCERRVVDTVTKVVTAVACVHCGHPIKAWGAPDRWWHVDLETGEHAYLNCGTHIDDDGNEVGGQPATPPDFTAVSTTTTEVVEWDCKPVLTAAEADADEMAAAIAAPERF